MFIDINKDSDNKVTKGRDDRVCQCEWIFCPLFCPKCKQETKINVKQLHVSVIKEPDAKTQSR